LQLMDSQQGTYELTSDKLKPLDAGKVVAKDKVSVEVAHPQPATPAVQAPPAAVSSTPGPAATLQQTAVPATQPAVQNVSVTTNAVIPSSMSSDQTSLGDAARLARQKKQPPQK
jgi:hypothetical protein